MSDHLPRAAVIVAARNAQATIAECLRSLLALRYPRELYEIIVVDNASGDATPAVAASFGDAVTLLQEPVPGPAAARNTGIRHARGDVIAFTDADCTVDPDWLRSLVAALASDTVGIAGGVILARRPASEIERFGEHVHNHARALLEICPPYAITMNWASPRPLLERVGLFDPSLRRCSDAELAYRIGRDGYSFAFCPDAIVYHRNEHSLHGLFREGWQHGFYGVPVRRRHARYIKESRLRRGAKTDPASSRTSRTDRRTAMFALAFGSGKRLGRTIGTGRFALMRPEPSPRPGSGRPPERSVDGQRRGIALRVQRAVLKTGQGGLRPLWRLVHGATMRGIALAMRWGHPDRTVFVKGSFAFGDPVYGISDLDLVVVTPDHPSSPGENRRRARRRWERLCRTVPLLADLAQHVWIYEEAEIHAATATTCFTYGLEASPSPQVGSAAFLGSRPLADEMGLLSHPPLAEPAREWRRLAGHHGFHPNGAGEDAQRRRITGWLSLQFLWRYAYRACLDPTAANVPFLCAKFVADPVRIWLWIARGEYVADRQRALERGLDELPEEEQALRRALALWRELSRLPDPPLAEFLPFLVALSTRIADCIAADLRDEQTTDVRLIAGDEGDLALPAGAGDRLRVLYPKGGSPSFLPLVDWRALAMPPPPDEVFSVVPADPTDLAAVRLATRRMDAGQYAALRADGLVLFPARVRALLRSVQCGSTDPVSLALSKGRRVATFPDVPGWSARDWARRAVAEHRAWLDSRVARSAEPDPEERLDDLAKLFTAARAALFLASLDDGDPELALPLAAVADRLAARDPRAAAAAVEAVEVYRAARRDDTPVAAHAVSGLSEAVTRLPAYRADTPARVEGSRRSSDQKRANDRLRSGREASPWSLE